MSLAAWPCDVPRCRERPRIDRSTASLAGTLGGVSLDTIATDDRAARRADPRYQRLMEATRAAARNGYDAVSMRDLAETCRMSMTTIYQFCRSKDQLIAEAHIDNLDAVRDQLMARPQPAPRRSNGCFVSSVATCVRWRATTS